MNIRCYFLRFSSYNDDFLFFHIFCCLLKNLSTITICICWNWNWTWHNGKPWMRCERGMRECEVLRRWMMWWFLGIVFQLFQLIAEETPCSSYSTRMTRISILSAQQQVIPAKCMPCDYTLSFGNGGCNACILYGVSCPLPYSFN